MKRLLLLLIVLLPGLLMHGQEKDTTQGKEFRYLFGFAKNKDKYAVINNPSDSIGRNDTVRLSAFYDMSLEQLDSIKALGIAPELERFINRLISVSAAKPLTQRTSPNIITLITEDEIRKSGARDLIDVLRLVPGFHFAQDLNGNVGIGLRGNWATEGKMLVMVDGMEINEYYTAHLYFGNHLPVDLIKRIEIIRGPGSAIYGGFAEFGVINIITRGADENQLEFGGGAGMMTKEYAGNQSWMHLGKTWKNFSLSLSSCNSTSQRSDQKIYSFYDAAASSSGAGVGDYVSVAGKSAIESTWSQLNLKWKNLTFSSLSDLYRTTDITQMNANRDHKVKYGFSGGYTELKYELKGGSKFTLTPKVNLGLQTPWEEGTPYAIAQNEHGTDSVNIVLLRLKESLTATYDFDHRTSILFGAEHYTDFTNIRDTVGQAYFTSDPKYQYAAAGIFGQALFKLPAFHLVLGARTELSSEFKPAIVPRIAITKKWNRYHFKVLLSQAFRAPTIGNLEQAFDGNYSVVYDTAGQAIGISSVGRNLEPERTFVFEAEFGVMLKNNMYLTANFFDFTSKDPIVYYYYQDNFLERTFGYGSGVYVYQNFPMSGTTGLELDYRIKGNWGYCNLNYSYYSVKNNPRIPVYSVNTFDFSAENQTEINPKQLLAFPSHKLSVSTFFDVSDRLSISFTGNYWSKTYGYDVMFLGDGYDDNGNFIPAAYHVSGRLVRYRPVFLANLYFTLRDLPIKNMNIGFGVHDIFNDSPVFIQPFFGLKAPLPGPSREVSLKLSYKIPLTKKK
ncbi:MAG: TonB-dependent receptor plug domain-containing protein [Bacteroidetes bacterium]|nr:TonB-dependent receptor plug domain-containing protein [Bacteroidota bacterium]MBU1720150.1 TonB-dependent receptor plug domain-containing protein [Bacteroidota bacterium]